MTGLHKQAMWLSLVVVASAFTHASGIAHAKPSSQYTTCTGRSVELVAFGQRGAFDISVPVAQSTTLVFPYRIESIIRLDARGKPSPAGMSKPAEHFNIVQVQDQNLVVMLFPGVLEGETASIDVTGGNITLRLRFRVAASLEAATASVFVKTDRPPGTVLEHSLCISLDQQAGESSRRLLTLADEAQGCQAELRKNNATSRAFTTEQADRVILRDIVTEKDPAPLDAARLGQRGVFFVGPMVVRNGSRDVLVFDILNLDPTDYHVDHLKALNEFGTRDHASLVEIIDRTKPEHDEGPLIIPAGAQVQAGVLLRDVKTIGRHVTLSMSEPDHLRPVTSDPVTYAPIRWSRGPVLDLLTEPPDENEGRLGIHIQAIGGIIWLGDGLKQDLLDPTSLKGLSVRVSYGLHRLFNVETEITGASSGEASFDNMSYNNMEGTLRRSASLGRVQFAGVLRLGEKIIPHLRLGLGLQGASYGSMLMRDNGTMTPGPEADIEVDVFMLFGGGLDIRLGTNFAAGITTSVEKLFSSDTRGINAGIHLGYAWKP